uniref:Mitotic spindle organizing protein 2B n=1 Tax=Equus caballus TaxID=9796 RepID=A0A5F5Q4X6_HORSE
MAAPGAGPGPGASPGLEATLQKLALRRKKVLSAEEMELYELAQAAGGAMDPDVFKILLDLLKLNVAPLAVFQMLKSMCAGQRLPSESQAPAAVSLPTSSAPETRDSREVLREPGRQRPSCHPLAWTRLGPGLAEESGQLSFPPWMQVGSQPGSP